MMQKVLMASLSALLMLAPVALAAEETNVGPGMTGTSSNASAGAGSTSTTTTTKSGVQNKKSGKFKFFNRLHRERQIRRFHRHMRRVRRDLHRR